MLGDLAPAEFPRLRSPTARSGLTGSSARGWDPPAWHDTCNRSPIRRQLAPTWWAVPSMPAFSALHQQLFFRPTPGAWASEPCPACSRPVLRPTPEVASTAHADGTLRGRSGTRPHRVPPAALVRTAWARLLRPQWWTVGGDPEGWASGRRARRRARGCPRDPPAWRRRGRVEGRSECR